MTKRPTPKELNGKVSNALAALAAGRKNFGTLKHWASDREELGLDSAAALWELLPKLLEEIKRAKPEECYAGQHPPQRSYECESAIKDQELWAYAWDSACLGKRMYLKFVLRKIGRDEWHYFHLDCHEARPKMK
jgi:glycine/D-amino acid oxidase-like deaminating enzyme